MYNGLHRFNASIDLDPHEPGRIWHISLLDGVPAD